MPLILGKSKTLRPNNPKEIRYVGSPENKAIQLTKEIARQFGLQSKKVKPKKFILR
jgi:hypothetical protein